MIVTHLKKEFKMKNVGRTYCTGLHIEHRDNKILVHQSNYTHKVLRRFNFLAAKSSRNLMVVQSLNPKKDNFCPKEDDEEILGSKIPILVWLELSYVGVMP